MNGPANPGAAPSNSASPGTKANASGRPVPAGGGGRAASKSESTTLPRAGPETTRWPSIRLVSVFWRRSAVGTTGTGSQAATRPSEEEGKDAEAHGVTVRVAKKRRSIPLPNGCSGWGAPRWVPVIAISARSGIRW